MTDRFWSKVDASGDCWEWTACTNDGGYGIYTEPDPVRPGRRNVRAHRWVWEALVGPIPRGLVIDHLCRVRHCVNPDHMEIVTRGENVLRGATVSAANAAKTECPQGHPYAGENLMIDKCPTSSNGLMRRCRTCRTKQQRESMARFVAKQKVSSDV